MVGVSAIPHTHLSYPLEQEYQTLYWEVIALREVYTRELLLYRLSRTLVASLLILPKKAVHCQIDSVQVAAERHSAVAVPGTVVVEHRIPDSVEAVVVVGIPAVAVALQVYYQGTENRMLQFPFCVASARCHPMSAF